MQEVYLAKWKDYIGASCECIFSNLDAAIFFVVSGLGSTVDWASFPAKEGKYPYEERNGTEDFSPVFRVQRQYNNKPIYGEVSKYRISTDWIVGNGIALASRTFFAQATGRDIIKVNGSGDKLHASIKNVKLK